GPHKVAAGHSVQGWFFFVDPGVGANPKQDFARWFRQMGQALGGDRVKPELPGYVQELRAAEKDVMDTLKPRLPERPQEEAELSKIAAEQGPKAVYAWIYGKDSEMVKALGDGSWQGLGATPEEGLKQILDAIRSALADPQSG